MRREKRSILRPSAAKAEDGKNGHADQPYRGWLGNWRRSVDVCPGNNLLIFGSPGLVRAFLALDAIDEFWIFQNPILLGAGLPYFDGAMKTRLKLASHRPFKNGVVRLHYVKGE